MARLRFVTAIALSAALIAPVRTSRADAPPAPSAAPSKPPVQLSVAHDSSRHDLTLYVQRGSAPLLGPARHQRSPLEPLCHAPCAFEAPFGLRAYGVSAGGSPVQLLDRELALEPGDALALRYRSRRWVRLSGWFLLFGGVSGSAAMLAVGETRNSVPLTVTGGVLSGVFVALGLLVTNLPDRVSGVLLRR